MEARLNGFLTTCHPEGLFCKTINWLILHHSSSMPTFAHWPGDFQNYHALRALISFSKIFRIHDNSPAVWLFHVIVIVFSLFMKTFAIILAKKRDIRLRYKQKSSFFCYFVKCFHS